MAKTPTSEILQAIAAVKDLKDVVATHEQAIDRLITRIEALEARLKTVEDRPPAPSP